MGKRCKSVSLDAPLIWRGNCRVEGLLPMLIKLLNLTFALAFLLAAVVQYNDPDPYVWVALYLVALASSVAFHRGRLHDKFGLVLAGVSLLWSCTLLPTVVEHPPPLAEVFGDVKMYAPGVEEAREMGGLWLVSGWMFTISWVTRRRALVRRRAAEER